jgi:hypothetical protein
MRPQRAPQIARREVIAALANVTMRIRFLLIADAFALIAAALVVASPARAQLLEPHTRVLNFGTVVGDGDAERPLRVVNRGTSALTIRDVQLTPPLSVALPTPVLDPGQSADLVVRFGGPRPAGRYEGALTIHLEGGGDPVAIDVNAILVPPIEIVPRTELVAVAERGVPALASVEIVSHLDRPLELSSGATANERFATALETVEPGRRYRLNLAMSGKGPAGARMDIVPLQTGDAEYPVVNVRARTLLRERVYTFPESVDFGRVPAAAAAVASTSLTVYQKGGSDFQIKVSTDVPGLELRPEKSQTSGDRWQILCSIDPAKVAAGRLAGSVFVETNDPEFARLTVPVAAVVQ